MGITRASKCGTGSKYGSHAFYFIISLLDEQGQKKGTFNLMKKTLYLFMLLVAAYLASCNADEPLALSITEIYTREFVKEFGVPAPGHDFSMATTAGLRVSSKSGDHITVTAEIDGEEYLFADCSVPTGTTKIPVTIPRSVSELNVSTPYGTRTVATDALVNLDDIKEKAKSSSDAISRAPQNADDNPYVAIYFKDIKKLFDANKSIKLDNIRGPYKNLQMPTNGYIFPIYWCKDKDGNKDYRVRFVTSQSGKNIDVRSSYIIFDNEQSGTTPFSALKWNDYGDEVGDLNPQSRFVHASSMRLPYAYFASEGHMINDDNIIVSRGIRIADYMSPDYNNRIDRVFLEVDYGFTSSEDYYTISQSPFRNAALWSGNYFDMELQYLSYAHNCFQQFGYGTTDSKVYIYDEQLDKGTQVGYFKEISGSGSLIYGFSTAPKQPAADNHLNYWDVAFLFVPLESWQAVGTISTGKTFYWNISVEDLGGTDDWDFNDAVFEFTDQIKDLTTENVGLKTFGTAAGPGDAEPVRIITVTPRAAGGTMPIYITYTGKVGKVPTIPNGFSQSQDEMYSVANQAIKDYINGLEFPEATYIVGKELHAWLGADDYTTMINTGEKNTYPKVESVQFVIPADTELGTVKDNATNLSSVANKTLCGFAVIVDRNNTLGIDAMNDDEEGMHRVDNLVMGEDMYVVGRPNFDKGEFAPQMILLGGYNWKWPQERVNINDAYPDFVTWLKDPDSYPNWTKNYIKEKVTY